MREWLIKKLGGFTRQVDGFETAEDLLTHLRETRNEREMEKILTEAVKKLYKLVDEDDVLFQTKDGNWYFTGKFLTETEKKQLKEEAELISKLRLWREINRAITYQNNKNMFLLSASEIDLIVGKSVLYNLNVIKKIIQTAQRM